jgi:uncharacterized protein YjdB
MFNRHSFGALLLAGLLLPVVSCGGMDPSLTSIVISPTNVSTAVAPRSIPQGFTQFTAIGYYTHPNHPPLTKDITNQVNWASSSPQVATISNAGVATATGPDPVTGLYWVGATTITASAPGFNGDIVSNTAVFNVGACTVCVGTDVVSVAVTPASQAVTGVGLPVQFEALGTTAGGLTVALNGLSGINWVSSNPTAATINAKSGLATTAGAGTTTITATFTNPDGTAVQGTATLTVTTTGSAEPLTAMTVAPNAQQALAVGQTAQFLAIATTGSGTSVNLTNQGAIVNGQAIKAATWTSSNPSVATINAATGVAQSVGAGAAVITAIASNPDGSVVTGAATYTVTVSSSTTQEPLTSLAIVPIAQTALAVNQTAHFLAIGTTGSGTTVNLTNQGATIGSATVKAAVWSSSNPSVATVDAATGVATALSAGVTAITAIATNPDGTVVTASAVFTVTVPTTKEPLVSLAIVPGAQTLTAANQTAGLIVIGTTGTGTTVNLTNQSATIGTATIKAAAWTSSVPTVAKIDAATGVVTALANGITAITAVASNPDGTVVTATAVITVTIPATPEPLASLAIVPAAQTLTAANQTAGLIAIGTTSSGTTVNLTGVTATIGTATIKAAAWTSSVPTVATINPATGVVTAVANGITAITAIAANPDGTVVTGTATVAVTISTTPEPLASLSIVPVSQSATANEPVQFLAIGTTSTGATVNLTNETAKIGSVTIQAATWTSSNPSVATINSTTGVATAVANGITAITAVAKNPDGTVVTGSATFTVTGPSTQEITSLTIIPGSQTVTLPLATGAPPAPTTYFIAVGTNGSSGLQEKVTVNWTSSNTAVATISNTGNTSGWATAVGQGTTTITAQYTNPAIGSTQANVVTATATLTVNGVAAEPLLSLTLLPPDQSVAFPGQSSQLIAIGKFSAAPVTQNLTGSSAYPITWSSSNTSVATVSTAANPTQTCNLNTAVPPVVVCTFDPDGLVKAVGQGTAVITAVAPASNPADGSVVTGVASFTVINGVAEQVTSLTIIPSSLSLSATGQPGQFVALGTSGSTGLQLDVTNSPQLTWSSSIPSYATITSGLNGGGNGEAKGVSAGITNITAEWTNPATSTTPSSVVTAQASVTVTTTPAAEPLLSIAVLPSSITDLDLEGTGQFLAYGTFSTAPTVLDITNGFFHAGFNSASCTAADAAANAQVLAADSAANLPVNNLPYPQCAFVPTTWVSDAPYIFPIDSAGTAGATGGLSTADGSGNADIYAMASNPDSTLVYSPQATFNCPYAAPTYGTITVTLPNGTTTTTTDYNDLLNPGTCNTLTIADSLLTTLTVFNAGVNTSGWLVTAPSATGTPDVIHCGGSVEQATQEGSVCEATYPNGTPVILTAPAVPANGSTPAVKFGGWSSSCVPCTLAGNTCTPIAAPPYYSEAGPNWCTVQVGGGCTLNPNTGAYTCSDQSNVAVGGIFN